MTTTTAFLQRPAQTDLNALNPYLQGIFAPVRDEVTVLDCPVIGEIPKDLHGVYVRNGPNPVKMPNTMHHWFDGDGMLHAIYFENGNAEYRNRYIRSSDHIADRENTCGAGGVFLPANRARGEKVYKDTANTDVIAHHGQLMALWYISGTPVRVDPRSLETIGEENFGGKLPRHVSAHSKADPNTGEFVFFDYALYEPWMSFGTVDRNNVLTHFQRVGLPAPRLPHDMGLTQNYVILHDLPVVFTDDARRRNLWQIRVLNQPARFGVVPRTGRGDQIKWFDVEPCYIYHVVNCWEDGDEVVMHACKMIANGLHPDPQYGPYAPMVAVLALHAVPVEWRLNMKTGAVKSRQLDDRLSEFPAINLDYASRPNRWSYHVSLARGDKLKFDGLYKYDLTSGAGQAHRFDAGVFGSEPGFAPRIGARDEDDGYVVTFVTDENTGKSEVQVIAAKQFEAGPIARVQLPVRVPLGFHATWMRGDQMVRA